MNNKPLFDVSDSNLAGKKALLLSTVWNAEILAPMQNEIQSVLESKNIACVNVQCPGSLELAATAKRYMVSNHIDGLIAIGLVVKGGTPHFKLVCNETYRSLGNLAYDFENVPVINGVLTVENLVQAEERINHAKINKGKEFADSLIHLMSA